MIQPNELITDFPHITNRSKVFEEYKDLNDFHVKSQIEYIK